MVVCKNCGKENQPQYKFCLYCGSEIAAVAGSDAPAPGPAVPAGLTAEPVTAPATATAAESIVAESADRQPSGWMRGRLDVGGEVQPAREISETPLPAPRPPPPLFTGEMSVQKGDAAPALRTRTAAGAGEVPPLVAPPRLRMPAPTTARSELVTTIRPDDSKPLTPAAPLPSVAPPRTDVRLCPTCKAPVPRGFQFCGQCGGRVDGADPPRRAVSTVGRVVGRLVLIRPDGSEGGHCPLNEGVNIVGRGAGPLFDADSYLSPLHLQVAPQEGGHFALRDAGSLNGVFIKLSEEEPIGDGAVFRIGQELLRFDTIRPPRPMEDGTEIMGSPNPGYWGRIAMIIGRGQDGSCFPLFGDAVVLGRERGDILFSEDGYVSGTHARISFRQGQVFLQDLASSNGTFLKIRGERTVRAGTFMLMGQQLFRVMLA